MAAKEKAFVASTRFVQAMASLMQTKRLQQITRKTSNGVGVELARYP